MQKVVGINLNGNAYQLEEPGYEALRSYLERALSRLQSNPDRAEIMADLEQALAEKCARYLGASKTVVTTAEIETIIAEMGPVESPDAATETGSSADASAAKGADGSAAQPEEGKNTRRRLYQIRQGAMISGVCNGLAAFLDVDVTVVRLLFVIITFATFGGWILAYLLMAMFIPYADTPEDRAAAYGFRLKAEELLGDSLHRASARARREWRRSFRRQQRDGRRNFSEKWQQQWQQHAAQSQAAMAACAPPMAPVASAAAGFALPLLAIVNAAVFVGWILVMLSAFMTRTIFGWPLPEELPLWGSLLILFVIYLVLTGPLRAVRHAHIAWGPYYSPWASLSTIVWIGCTLLFLWLAYQHFPQVHELLDQLPSLWQRRDVSFIV
jgi:phage shock protein PspC (stress-responsive transcriptional regulator)